MTITRLHEKKKTEELELAARILGAFKEEGCEQPWLSISGGLPPDRLYVTQLVRGGSTPIMSTTEESGVPVRKIDDMLRDAEAQMDAMGAETFVGRLYSGVSTPDPEFTRLKEEWELGFFVQQYNRLHSPALVWACHNQPGTNHADFSVYAADKSYLWDIEVTALFSTPTTEHPKGYEDFSPYPTRRDASDPCVLHVEIDEPRKSQPYATLEWVVGKHLRDKYPPYWLVIYDNEHGIQHPNKHLSSLIKGILQKRAQRGRLPSNLLQVWAFDLSGVLRVWA